MLKYQRNPSTLGTCDDWINSRYIESKYSPKYPQMTPIISATICLPQYITSKNSSCKSTNPMEWVESIFPPKQMKSSTNRIIPLASWSEHPCPYCILRRYFTRSWRHFSMKINGNDIATVEDWNSWSLMWSKWTRVDDCLSSDHHQGLLWKQLEKTVSYTTTLNSLLIGG